MNQYDELHENLALYALDALPPEDVDAVEQALADNPELWEVVDQNRAGLAKLTETSTAAPEHVWDNISAAIGFDRTGADQTGLEEGTSRPNLQAVPPTSGPTSESIESGLETSKSASNESTSNGRLYPSTRQWIWQAAAAAAVFAIVGFGFGRLTVAPADPLLEAAEAIQARADTVVAELVADGITAEIVLSEDGEGYLFSDNLSALPANRTYQLWAVTAGGVTSAGVLGSDPGIVAFHTARASEVQALVITEENAGGVVTSEGTVIATWGV